VKFSAVVIHGKKIGAQLGFPTANFNVKDLYLDSGVYAGIIQIDGKKYNSAIAIFGNPKRAEAHLICFKGRHIYGMTAEVEVLKKISEIEKCDGFDLLSKKISRDVKLVKEYFDGFV
jgi:riboflavin kinase/FMN adenylyltransferase